ncbi:tetratricopeptide repeat protein [Zobellia galactanivorans]|uniref:tetratricopeptide repeat protein n=1 Tax=Zobellia galactanivorans (strain DSM 12802 / CCUG 47099 / CIP 106680 / NCIMB 13871 / Dsij) TaxID=63186 RepID=UPI001C07BD8A|nr:hypothetical protein [Zobellia galactanivorans]MBU3026651.1 hypothetical protein [Zobellia galactanivorans]
MKTRQLILLFVGGFFWVSLLAYAQETPAIDENQSAEVFLEDYSDDFQEKFFEALKQKGIENYDRAINLMLECKQLDAENDVVDHELAKLYLKEKQYPVAEEYALVALLARPDNPWYVDTYVDIALKQQKSVDSSREQLPFDNVKFKENLALIFFRKGRAKEAQSVLKETPKSSFTQQLSIKVADLIEAQEAAASKSSFTFSNDGGSESGSFEQYRSRIQGMLQTKNYLALDRVAAEALESYPSQPYFYYAQGLALNRKGRAREAIETLETGLDYLVGDISLANKFYQELSDAYNSINNSVKANMYLRKIKSGF